MKFLCANCDEPMKLEEATGPAEGSLSITFGCPKCGNRTSLLTNPKETQLVRALNVHVGGRAVPAEPMELVRGTLARQHGQAFAPKLDASRSSQGLVWTEEAEERLGNVPTFAREMARQAIEEYARRHGYSEVTPEVMSEARDKMGM